MAPLEGKNVAKNVHELRQTEFGTGTEFEIETEFGTEFKTGTGTETVYSNWANLTLRWFGARNSLHLAYASSSPEPKVRPQS